MDIIEAIKERKKSVYRDRQVGLAKSLFSSWILQ